MNKRIKEFIDKRTLSSEMELNEPLNNAIDILEKSNEIVLEIAEKNLVRLSEQVYWPSMHDMYKRSYEYCCGALGCFLIMQFQSSEALCRTAIEGAVNLHYVSLGDSMAKQIAYFKNHIEIGRKQNASWRMSVEQSDYPNAAKKHHFDSIEQKSRALDRYEDMLRQSLSLADVHFDESIRKWPSIFDRFREIGDEVGYRTVYLSLCSQVHNNAEDVLNSIMTRVVANVRGMDEAIFIQQYNFSLFMSLTAIQYHIMATAMYIGKFEIDTKGLMSLYKDVLRFQVLVMENGPMHIRDKIYVETKL